VTGRQRLTVSTVPGDRRFITDTGIGKALLLDDEDAELIRLLKRKELGRGAQAAWIKRMHEHQDRGAVINQSEVGDGVNSVAAPVRDARGEIVVALSIAGASIYLGEKVMRQLAALVRASAALISSALGYKERGRSA
jgi:DNA-binding IclR family transcriptional regulator